jgi:hypothetical protein
MISHENARAGFPAGAIPTVDFLLHHLAAAVKKMAVKTQVRRSLHARLVNFVHAGGQSR